jgi:hypothetical protein
MLWLPVIGVFILVGRTGWEQPVIQSLAATRDANVSTQELEVVLND